MKILALVVVLAMSGCTAVVQKEDPVPSQDQPLLSNALVGEESVQSTPTPEPQPAQFGLSVLNASGYRHPYMSWNEDGDANWQLNLTARIWNNSTHDSQANEMTAVSNEGRVYNCVPNDNAMLAASYSVVLDITCITDGIPRQLQLLRWRDASSPIPEYVQ